MKKFLGFVLSLGLIFGLGGLINVKASNEVIIDKLTPTSLNLGGNYALYHSDVFPSGAIYKTTAMTNQKSEYIQLTDEHYAGIVVDYAPLNYKPTKIKVLWDTGRTSPDRSFDFYGKNERYLSPSDLHHENTQGEFIDTTSKDLNGLEYELTDDYKYLGLRAYKAAIYLKSIEITWTKVSDIKGARVEFVLNNGSKNEIINNELNKPLIYVPTIYKAFNSFGGWYKDSTLTEEFNTRENITGDILLYAKWNEIPTSNISDVLNLNVDKEVVVEGKYSKLSNAQYFIEDETGLIQIHDRYLIKECTKNAIYKVHGIFKPEYNTISDLKGILKTGEAPVIPSPEPEPDPEPIEPEPIINPISDINTNSSIRMTYNISKCEPIKVDLRFGGIIPTSLYDSNSKYYMVILDSNKEFNINSKADLDTLITNGYALEMKPALVDNGYQMGWVITNMENHYDLKLHGRIVMVDGDNLFLSRASNQVSLLDTVRSTLRNGGLDKVIIDTLSKLIA